MVTVGQQPQHRSVILTLDDAQVVVAQPGDRSRVRVVGVVLAALPEPSRRTRADSVAGTSTTVSPALTSCWASR